MKAIVLDDELGSIQTLEALLEAEHPDVRLVQSFQRTDAALAALPTLAPDLIFLDIEMPGMNGFEFLQAVERLGLHPEVIFTTAYDRYKSSARHYAALDFLMKPLDAEPLRAAIDRVRAFIERHERAARTNVFLHNQRQQALLDKRIILPGKDRSPVVRLGDIVSLEASGPYTKFHLAGKKTFVVSRAIGYWEPMLTGPDMPFFRVHESHIVGIVHFNALVNEDGGLVEMKDGLKVPIARRRKEEFQKWLMGFII